MLILVEKITPRLEYTFDFVLKGTLKISYRFTSDQEQFIQSRDAIKWSYGIELEGQNFLPSMGLLFEKKIEPQNLSKIQFENIVPIFKTKNGIGFDIFSSIFYLISRYEEYLPCVMDAHGRYSAYQSVAFEFGFLDKAMVNRYIFWIAEWMRSQFSSIELRLPKWTTIYSFDVDHPYYAKDIPLNRKIARTLKNVSEIGEKDRYDTYDFILDTLHDIPSIFFFLCPKIPSPNDNFNKRESQGYRDLILKIRARSKIGLHPSYYADENHLLNEETQWLSAIHQRQIKSVRYHYLRNNIETSYRNMIESKIVYDFSMAYGNHSGFRSSTSLPFYYFDLRANKKTDLIVQTSCIMDSCFEYGYEDNFDKKFEALFLEVKTYGGVFVPIFHNDILAKEKWKENLIHAVKLIRNEI